MIGLDVKNTKKKSSFYFLNKYILSGDAKSVDKVAFAGSMNCICSENLSLIATEMSATAAESKSKKPVKHFLLSWREGEQPTQKQVDEAVKIALQELGLEGHQCLYALHKNTTNYHLHLSVNKVNPYSFKAVEPNNGLTEIAMERAARKIEAIQGWQVEKNAWSVCDKDGIVKTDGNPKIAAASKNVPQMAKDKENRYGEKSAIRIAQEKILPLIESAESWQQVHSRLSRAGAKYTKKGSGAVFVIGDVVIKASSVSKRCTMKNMEAKFGQYTEAPVDFQVDEEGNFDLDKIQSAHISEPVRELRDNDMWKAYNKDRREYFKLKKEDKVKLRAEIAQKFKDLKLAQKKEREELNKRGNWTGRGRLRNALRSAMALKHAQEKAELQEQVTTLRKKFDNEYPVFLGFEAWLRVKKKDKEAELYRYRKELYAAGENFIKGYPEKYIMPEHTEDIRSFKAIFSNDHKEIYYVDTENGNRFSFKDKGRAIYMQQIDEKAILAALQLGQQKWGAVKLSGTAQYLNKCIEVAVKNNIRITNPELQDKIKMAKEMETQLRAEVPVQKELDGLRRYAKAVGAEHIKVTATEFFDDGSKRGFMVNKKDGYEDGYTPEQLEKSIQRLVNLKNQGRNIYYTPISKDKYHLLVDDLTADAVGEMLVDGYDPAMIIESSKGNYQALFTVDKLGTEYDREIGNQLVRELNQKYGDPKVSGEIHAHRAPGFDNRKPKHRQPDGSYPEIKILEEKGGKCSKCAVRIKEIHQEIIQREASRPKITIDKDTSTDTAKAYTKHFYDIMRLQKKRGIDKSEMDASRIDSMICIRLRATGHSSEAIKETVKTLAPQTRVIIGSAGTHNWENYAERSVNYAFSQKGDTQILQNERLIPQWRKVEQTPLQEKMQIPVIESER